MRFFWQPEPHINAEIRLPTPGNEIKDYSFAYRLASSPNEWQPCISPGCGIDEVKARLEHIHGDQLLEVRHVRK